MTNINCIKNNKEKELRIKEREKYNFNWQLKYTTLKPILGCKEVGWESACQEGKWEILQTN